MKFMSFLDKLQGTVSLHIRAGMISPLCPLCADRFDYILLETTGLANPGPVISMLWTDEELESPLRLDSVVTVR